MRLSKLEILALLVALFTALHFYTMHEWKERALPSEKFFIKKDKSPIVVAFGDSLTAGAGVSKDLSYPVQLSNMLGFEVINAGKSFERTRDALRRLSSVLKQNKPDIILIEEGYDDLLRGRKHSQIKENLKQMVQIAKNSRAKVILIGMPDMDMIDLVLMSDIGLYEEVAKEMGVDYIPDLFGPVLSRENLKSDDHHPNAEGYKRVAKTIYKYLQERLQ